MTTPKTPEQLATRIATIVDEFFREAERATLDAVGRAFATARACNKSGAPQRSKDVFERPRKHSSRRTRDEIAQAAERLAAAIIDRPGESMTNFAGQLGLSVRDLHRPMAMLKRQGRIRSVGARHLTRYFPTAKVSA